MTEPPDPPEHEVPRPSHPAPWDDLPAHEEPPPAGAWRADDPWSYDDEAEEGAGGELADEHAGGSPASATVQVPLAHDDVTTFSRPGFSPPAWEPIEDDAEEEAAFAGQEAALEEEQYEGEGSEGEGEQGEGEEYEEDEYDEFLDDELEEQELEEDDVAASGNALPGIWAAVDAIDAHVGDLERADFWDNSEDVEGDSLAGAMEELRDHLAAAFDVVRELAANMVPVAEQLEAVSSGTADVDAKIVAIADAIDGRFARVEQGMGELADWMEARFATLEEAIGNDLDDLGEEVNGLVTAAASRDVEEGAAPEPAPARTIVAGDVNIEDAFAQVADRLEEIATEVTARQAQLEAQIANLTEQVVGYRRRVQVHARPPVVTDEQLQALVAGIVAATAEQERVTQAERTLIEQLEGRKGRKRRGE